MPDNPNHCFYQSPVTLGVVTHRIVNANVMLDSFDFFDAKELISVLGVHDFLVTNMTGSNNDLALIARLAGVQTVTLTLVDPGANNAGSSIEVTGGDVVVVLATGGTGAITTTAAQLKALIEANAAAAALLVVNFAPSNDGTGIVTALAQTSLSGPTGTLPTLDLTLQSSIDDANFFDTAAFAQMTDVGIQRGTFGFLGTRGRWSFVVGGTNPLFAVSVNGVYKP